MRSSNFALRIQPSLLDELRLISEQEGVGVNQLINVAIAEKLAQLRTMKWFAARAGSGNTKAGDKLLRDLTRGGQEPPREGDGLTRRAKKATG